MNILAIETSCDETSVSIVRDGKHVLSNVVFTQIDIHTKYGGVVPEIASRNHIEKITYVLEQAINEAKIALYDIDAIAVTKAPGLVGSLMVGVNTAETIAMYYQKPLIYINHIHGHIYANALEHELIFPLIALVVSGGHTEIIFMQNHYQFETIGETLDDAVGEAYDKVARVINVGYPGGPILDKMARLGQPTYKLPRIRLSKDSYDFSFSGLKSAVLNLHNKALSNNESLDFNNLAASFQEAVVEVLCEKTIRAALQYEAKQIVLAGGVAANSYLRQQMSSLMENVTTTNLIYPSIQYCGDNAAMIGAAAYYANNSKR